MPSYELAINVIGKDNASGPLSSVKRALERVGEVALGVTAAHALERIADGFFAMGEQAIGAVAKFQMIELTLASLVSREMVQLSDGTQTIADVLPVAEKRAKGLMDELSRMAILSPYQTDAIMYTYRMAMAFGYGSDEAMEFSGALSNVAAGVGADMSMLERMAYNLAQVRLQGKVTALDIRQLAQAGFDLNSVLKYVSTQMGYNINDHKDFNALIASGKITWADFTKYFAKYADEMFGGASERMARSLQGLKSTMNDVFLFTMPTILGGAAEVVGELLNKVLDLFLTLKDSDVLKEWGSNLKKYFERVLAPATKFIDFLVEYDKRLNSIFKSKGTREGGIGDPKASGLIEHIDMLQRVREGIEYAFGSQALAIFDNFRNIITGVFTLFGKIRDVAKEFAAGNVAGIIGILGLTGPAASLATTILTTLVDLFGRLSDSFMLLLQGDLQGAFEALKIPDSVVGVLDSVWQAIKNLGEFLITYGPQIVDVLGQFIGRLFGASSGPKAGGGMGEVTTIFETMSQTLLAKGPSIVAWLDDFLTKLTDEWIPAAVDFAKTVIEKWIPAFGQFLESAGAVLIPLLAIFGGVLASKKLGPIALGLGSIIEKILVLAGEIAGAGGMTAFFGGIKDMLVIIGTTLGPIITAITPFIPYILIGLGLIAGIILTVIGAIGALGLAFITNFGGFRDIVFQVWGAISQALAPAIASLKESAGPLWESIKALFVALAPYIEIVVKAIGGLLIPVIGFLVGVLSGAIGFLTGLINGLTMFFNGIATFISGITSVFTGVFEFIKGLVTGDTELIKQGIASMAEGIVGIFSGFGMTVLSFFATFFESIILGVSNFVTGFLGFIGNLVEALTGSTLITDMLDTVREAFTTFFGNIAEDLGTWVADFLEVVGGLGEDLYAIGEDILQGLWDGLAAKWTKLKAWFDSTIGKLVKSTEQTMEIGSPSKVFARIGKNMMQGWQQGIAQNARLPISAMGAVGQSVMPGHATSITQTNTYNVRDSLDAELIARKAARLILEGTER